MVSRSVDPSKHSKNPMNNGPLHTNLQMLLHVVASAAEAKLGALFHNGQTTLLLSTTLKDISHKQHPTPI